MKTKHLVACLTLSLAMAIAPAAQAQVAKGIIDPNVAGEKDLLSLPNMTPAIVKGIMDNRPFMTVSDLNTFLVGQKLTPEQTASFYGKAFIHINLNTATRDEIMLIPGAGT